MRIVGVKNCGAVGWDGLGQHPLLPTGGFKPAIIPVVIASNRGDYADLGSQDSRLLADLAWPGTANFVHAILGRRPKRDDATRDGTLPVFVDVDVAFPVRGEDRADQLGSGRLAAASGNADIGDLRVQTAFRHPGPGQQPDLDGASCATRANVSDEFRDPASRDPQCVCQRSWERERGTHIAAIASSDSSGLPEAVLGASWKGGGLGVR